MALEDQRYGRDKSTIVDKTYIDSGEYRRKFDSIIDDQQIARVLYSKAKEMLVHRSGTKIEDMYWIDSRTGEIVASVIDQTEDTQQEIIYSERVKKAIQNNKYLITMHTHPGSMPPSMEDFNAFFQNGYKIGIVLCHDGTIYQYKSEQKIEIELYDLYITRYYKRGYNEKEAQISTLNTLKRNYDIDFWEVV